MEKYVETLVNEICSQIQKSKNYKIQTIYFGGGTPSLLPAQLLEKIVQAIYKTFEVAQDVECTIEGNPEQLTQEYLNELKQLGFNRISIGIQSFNDKILHFLGRTHSAKDAFVAIDNVQKAGFDNISIDLIYGIYLRSIEDWLYELQTVFQRPVKHLSAYSLTVEENTLLYKKILEKKIVNTDEEQPLVEMQLLMDEAEKNGFEHYEVSNFAKNNYRSQHNSNYWNGTPYLGFGASAHSFTGTSRSWNISNVEKYCEAIADNRPFFEAEQLTPENQYIEAFLLGLRTKEGIDLRHFETRFGADKQNNLLQSLQKIDPQFYEIKSDFLIITKKGLVLLDYITEKLIT